jgi:hypothetical protein
MRWEGEAPECNQPPAQSALSAWPAERMKQHGRAGGSVRGTQDRITSSSKLVRFLPLQNKSPTQKLKEENRRNELATSNSRLGHDASLMRRDKHRVKIRQRLIDALEPRPTKRQTPNGLTRTANRLLYRLAGLVLELLSSAPRFTWVVPTP